MKIRNDAYVAIEYSLTLENGEVIDQSSPGEALPFIFGKGMIVQGLEEALEGQEVGFTGRVAVDPEKGYGESKKDLLQEIPRDRFPEEVDLGSGQVFQADTPHGPVNFHVADVRDDVIIADFNHPLAGKKLFFDIKVAEVREATEEDIAAFSCGHDCDHDCGHGCDGHH